jgi:hypothetical protein
MLHSYYIWSKRCTPGSYHAKKNSRVNPKVKDKETDRCALDMGSTLERR